MKLQLAMDFCKTYGAAKAILGEVGSYVDIIELGTPLLMENGLDIIREAKKDFPDKLILADLKIMDAGRYETEEALKMGADIVTVMAVTEDETIRAAVRCADEYGKKIMVDLLAVKDVEARIEAMDGLGVGYICMHTSKDLQRDGMNMAETFGKYKSFVKHAGIALAGGIKAETVADYAQLEPEIIIVGEGIMSQPDRRLSAMTIKNAMR